MARDVRGPESTSRGPDIGVVSRARFPYASQGAELRPPVPFYLLLTHIELTHLGPIGRGEDRTRFLAMEGEHACLSFYRLLSIAPLEASLG